MQQRVGHGPVFDHDDQTLRSPSRTGATSKMAEAKLRDRRVINCPEKVSSFLAQRYHLFDQKVMGALYLDVKGLAENRSPTF